MCKIAVWARRASMRGLKVIECRNSEISDLWFDQPFLIDFNNAKLILNLVSDLIFILFDVLTQQFGQHIQCFARPSMMGDI
jgi:hypothetical protein